MPDRKNANLAASHRILWSVLVGVGIGIILATSFVRGRALHTAYRSRKNFGKSCGSTPFIADPNLGIGERPRVSTSLRNSHGPRLLFLGDRRLWGECDAQESSLPYLVAKGVHGTLVPGVPVVFNLAQELAVAQKKIKVTSPDLILVQYSSWLVDRALSPYVQDPLGFLGAAHFAVNKKNKVALQPPPFRTAWADSQWDRGEMNFFVRAIPLFFFDWFHQLRFSLHNTDKPAPRSALVRFAYDSMARLAEKKEARLFIVFIGRWDQSDAQTITSVMPASLVTTGEVLEKQWNQDRSPEFTSEFEEWKSYPPVLSKEPPLKKIPAILAPTFIEAIHQVQASFAPQGL